MLQPNPANAAGWTLAALAVQLTAGVAADAAGRLFGFALLLVCWLMNGYAALRLRCTAALAAAAAGAALCVLMMAGASGWAVSMASNLLFLLYYLPLLNLGASLAPWASFPIVLYTICFLLLAAASLAGCKLRERR